MTSVEFITTLFGLMALLVTGVGIVVTIALTRVSHAQTDEASKFFQVQQFEATFFSLLASQRDIINSMDIRTSYSTEGQPAGRVIHTGRDCFKYFYHYYERLHTKDILSFWKNNPKADLSADKKVSIEYFLIIGLYNRLYFTYQGDLGHYFRNLYHIVRFVDEADIIQDKMKYIRLIRSQLSSYELIMLFYNCLSEKGREKFKPLIEKYQLLKNTEYNLLFHSSHLNKYLPSAYGKSKSFKSL